MLSGLCCCFSCVPDTKVEQKSYGGMSAGYERFYSSIHPLLLVGSIHTVKRRRAARSPPHVSHIIHPSDHDFFQSWCQHLRGISIFTNRNNTENITPSSYSLSQPQGLYNMNSMVMLSSAMMVDYSITDTNEPRCNCDCNCDCILHCKSNKRKR